MRAGDEIRRSRVGQSRAYMGQSDEAVESRDKETPRTGALTISERNSCDYLRDHNCAGCCTCTLC